MLRLPIEALKAQQKALARNLILRALPLPDVVAGADVSYDTQRGLSWGAIVVLKRENFEVLDQAVAVKETPFPYLPGFLSFREVPVLKEAFYQLKVKPQVILVDGQGLLHPRGLGLASHLGLELGIPTIGVAKKPLVGDFVLPPEARGSWSPVYVNGQWKGIVLRTRKGVKPVFISPGHLTDLESSLRIVWACLGRYRLPEPIRQAHLLSQRAKS